MPDETELIDVAESQSVEAVEILLDELRSARLRTPKVDLRLPKNLRAASLGGAAAVMQLTGTWARLFTDQGALRTYFTDDVTMSQLEETLGQYEHLLTAASVAPRVWSQGRSKDITGLVHEAARRVLRARRTAPPRRLMRSFFEIVPDQWPDLAPTSLYLRGDARYPLDLKDEYLPLAERILQLRQKRAPVNFDPKAVSSLSWALFEIFQNTDQWAKSLPSREGRDQRAVPSSRSIYARWHSFDLADAAQRVGASPSLHAYLRRTPGSDGRHRYFEISVLDMGPGLAGWRASDRGRLHTELNEHEDADVRWSLAKRRTTSLDPTKGMGFHRAFLNLSDAEGFVHIRTGRTSAYRDFTSVPYPSDRESADAALPEERRANWTDLEPWVEGDGPRQDPVSLTVGTRVTMLIPDTDSSADEEA